MKTKLFLRYLFWFLVLAVMVFIFTMSGQNATVSSKASESFIRFFLDGIKFLDEEAKAVLVSSLQFVVRKAAHFTVFAVLGILSYLAMLTYSVKSKTQIYTSGAISLTYAVFDEIHQIFIDGRAGRLYDVGIDFLGSVVGIALVYLIVKSIKQRRKKNA